MQLARKLSSLLKLTAVDRLDGCSREQLKTIQPCIPLHGLLCFSPCLPVSIQRCASAAQLEYCIPQHGIMQKTKRPQGDAQADSWRPCAGIIC